ncbi:hypothetical protein HZ326_29499 [Fusarium oxysporum f. sp. albedinis]|nr:hypothetical protein HZ326_29499 [Fusarium oxysporum f. sp. albedinis]
MGPYQLCVASTIFVSRIGSLIVMGHGVQRGMKMAKLERIMRHWKVLSERRAISRDTRAYFPFHALLMLALTTGPHVMVRLQIDKLVRIRFIEVQYLLRFDQCWEVLLTAGELESMKVLMNVVYILNAFIKGATDNCNTVVLGTTRSCSDAVPRPANKRTAYTVSHKYFAAFARALAGRTIKYAGELRYHYRMFTVSLYDINYCVFATGRGLKQIDGIIGSL